MEQHSATWATVIEPELGGRLSSLRDPAGREWLRRNPDTALTAARARVRPGDPFIDAGGWEECFPTIAGGSDHGEVWSRPWTDHDGTLSITTAQYSLQRTIEAAGPHLIARYRLQGEPGLRFVWAAHLTLDLSPRARLVAPAGTRCRLWPEHWRARNVASIDGLWPAPLGAPLDSLSPDGSALFFMLIDAESLVVVDGREVTFHLDAPGQPTAIAVWRNLGAWPADAPYRSIGIEPAIGHHYDRDLAEPVDLGLVGTSGIVEWTLRIGVG